MRKDDEAENITNLFSEGSDVPPDTVRNRILQGLYFSFNAVRFVDRIVPQHVSRFQEL